MASCFYITTLKNILNSIFYHIAIIIDKRRQQYINYKDNGKRPQLESYISIKLILYKTKKIYNNSTSTEILQFCTISTAEQIFSRINQI